MKQKLLLALLLIFSMKSFSQDSKFSLELNYPIPIDENFIGKNFNGIIDAGLKYRFVNLEVISIGAAFNAGMYKNTKGDRVQPFDVTTYIFSPKIYAEFNMKSITKLHPSLGLGYSVINSKADVYRFNNQNNFSVSSSEKENGVNLNLGVAHDITNKLFAQVQYDFIKISVDNEVPDIKYNSNINILKIGLGYRL
ncbi:outer membrane beta-barrel protein [Sediminibacter sp. Hel_I_10]|uniref:outer membrane beta-barrel protein n=1 Tax=Sediminibacter sp. Hel_I_10 TaxID=1392490 RepID=UPI0005696C23|nr:outer membrane beta-barrel protein [Sediminibacter sp. Hel_I_10]